MSEKLSSITEEATSVEDTDRVYIVQGGVSKYIDGATLNSLFSGGASFSAGSEETNSSIQLQTDLYRSYGQDTARTGNITIDDANCELGFTARVIHEDSAPPSFVTSLLVLETGSYVVDVRNDIYISKTSSTELTVAYTQPSDNSEFVLPSNFTLTLATQSDNTFTSTTSATWGSGAWADSVISGDGYIEMQYSTTNNLPTLVGLSENVESGIAAIDYVAQIGGDSKIYRKEGGGSSVDTGFTIATDDIIRIERSGTDILMKRSQNGGTSYTTLYTWNSVTSNDLYACLYMNGSGKEVEIVGMEL